MMVSRRLQDALAAGANGDLIEQARTELYRGQCNCSYWHGAFGGAYLPHLRNAVYQHLIAADNLLDELDGRGMADGDQPWVELTADDYNFDARQEVRLANDRLMALARSGRGGHLYELDVRSICHNLLATLTRRRRGLSSQGARRANRAATATWPAFTTASSSSRTVSTSGCSTTATRARA